MDTDTDHPNRPLDDQRPVIAVTPAIDDADGIPTVVENPGQAILSLREAADADALRLEALRVELADARRHIATAHHNLTTERNLVGVLGRERDALAAQLAAIESANVGAALDDREERRQITARVSELVTERDNARAEVAAVKRQLEVENNLRLKLQAQISRDQDIAQMKVATLVGEIEQANRRADQLELVQRMLKGELSRARNELARVVQHETDLRGFAKQVIERLDDQAEQIRALRGPRGDE